MRPRRTHLAPSFGYVIYIRGGAQEVWEALTDPEATAVYWRHRNVTSWKPGARWQHLTLDDPPVAEVTGQILDAQPGELLRITFESPKTFPEPNPAVVTISLTEGDGITRLTLLHEELPDNKALVQVAHGWPAVLSNLKTYVESGSALPQDPWLLEPAAGRID